MVDGGGLEKLIAPCGEFANPLGKVRTLREIGLDERVASCGVLTVPF